MGDFVKALFGGGGDQLADQRRAQEAAQARARTDRQEAENKAALALSASSRRKTLAFRDEQRSDKLG